jgi:hypothetical protein
MMVARLSNLKRGTTQSCGCLRAELLLKRNAGTRNHAYRHGQVDTPLYGVWKNMKGRCLNQNHPEYCDYGGRGINVCKQWQRSAAAFIQWALAHGYERGLYLDREDNDGNYTPNNCRFVTPKVSIHNRRPRSRWKTERQHR